MLKDFNQYTEDQKLRLVLQGLDFAICETYKDRKDYLAYKELKLEEVSENRKQEMDILDLLEKLGYPMEEMGTYLYKNMVVKVANHLDALSTKQNVYDCKDLIEQLENKFSQFYVDVARNDLDMGVKTFHRYVEDANLKIDYSKANPDLYFQVFGNFSEEINYIKQAFLLGIYVSGNLKCKKIDEPMVKTLPSIPTVTNQI